MRPDLAPAAPNAILNAKARRRASPTGNEKRDARRSDALARLLIVQRFLVQLILTSLAVYAAKALFPDLIQVSSVESAVLFALVLGLCNAILRPILLILTFPLTILTLGLFTLVVNSLVFWAATIVHVGVNVSGFRGAFVGALAVSIVSVLAGRLQRRS
jgi:putative membrane protein